MIQRALFGKGDHDPLGLVVAALALEHDAVGADLENAKDRIAFDQGAEAGVAGDEIRKHL